MKKSDKERSDIVKDFKEVIECLDNGVPVYYLEDTYRVVKSETRTLHIYNSKDKMLMILRQSDCKDCYTK